MPNPIATHLSRCRFVSGRCHSGIAAVAAGGEISPHVDRSARPVLRERSGSVASDNHWQNDDVCNQRLASRDRI